MFTVYSKSQKEGGVTKVPFIFVTCDAHYYIKDQLFFLTTLLVPNPIIAKAHHLAALRRNTRFLCPCFVIDSLLFPPIIPACFGSLITHAYQFTGASIIDDGSSNKSDFNPMFVDEIGMILLGYSPSFHSQGTMYLYHGSQKMS